jgi:hypothetical protein
MLTCCRHTGNFNFSASAMARFRRYAVRVRTMSFPDSALKLVLQKAALVKALCPDTPSLPNLEEVEVYAAADITWVPLVAMFLHSGVRRLVIHTEDQNGYSFFTYPDFFREVLLRAPSLESLEITPCSMLTVSRVWRPEDAGILASYARQFHDLVRLAAPATVLFHVDNISTALPKLRVLLETTALRPKIVSELSRWPSQIAKSGTSPSLLTIISLNNNISHLRILYLETNMSALDQPNISAFFRMLCDRCLALEELTIMWTLWTLLPRPP